MAVYSLRYARALDQVATATHLDTEQAQRQMQDFVATLAGSQDLREVLMDPSIPNEQKLRVLDAMAGRLGMARPVRNFLAVIIDHQRLAALNEILTEYAAIADKGSGLTEVEIVTARPIEEAERSALEAKAGALAGTRIRATYFQDASLLGGAVLKIGSTVFDGSLRGQLAQLKRRLADGVSLPAAVPQDTVQGSAA